MNLEELVVQIFEKIIKKYNLQISTISENEVVLFSSSYILSFLYHSAELVVVYFEKTKTGELYQYNIDSFIASSISEEDRIEIKEKFKNEPQIVIELELLARTLVKKWDNLLSGERDWIKEYQEFSLHIPARNVTWLKDEKYMEKIYGDILIENE